VRRVEFFRAIELGDEPSAAEGLDLDSMIIESDYDGVKLGNEMTPEFITDMLERFKNGKKIHKKYVYQIVMAVKKIVYDEPTMVEMEIAGDATLTVCGDTHGKIGWDRPFSSLVNALIMRALISDTEQVNSST
jgi:serine/threonine-protein phosphatase 5